MANELMKQVNELKSMIESRKDSIASLLPKHLTVERMMKIAVHAAAINPKLLDCTKASYLDCFIKCAELGLEPNTPLQHCYLIPYKNQATLQIGYQGLVELARRSGKIKTLIASAIYEKDKYSVTKGTDPKIIHEPCLTEDPGKPLMYYAVCKLDDDAIQFEVMTVSEIEKIKNKFSKTSNIWQENFDEMAKKTVIKRLCKLLPKSIELQEAIDLDNEPMNITPENLDLGLPETEAERMIREAQEKVTDATIEEPTQEELK